MRISCEYLQKHYANATLKYDKRLFIALLHYTIFVEMIIYFINKKKPLRGEIKEARVERLHYAGTRVLVAGISTIRRICMLFGMRAL